MEHLYGEFTEEQMKYAKEKIRHSIFFLLLCVDPKTSWEYEDVDVNKSFNDLMLKLGGMNKLLRCQPEIVIAMSLLQAANIEFNKENFDYNIYRKLILDAGAEIEKLREED